MMIFLAAYSVLGIIVVSAADSVVDAGDKGPLVRCIFWVMAFAIWPAIAGWLLAGRKA